MKVFLVAAVTALPITAQADPCESIREMRDAMQEHLPGVVEDLRDVVAVGSTYQLIVSDEGTKDALEATVDRSGSALASLADMGETAAEAARASGCQID